MNQPLFIYVHGFNSSPASAKAQLFIEHMTELGYGGQVLVPELSSWPEEAMETLDDLIRKHFDHTIVLIGSSLGGYYSTYLAERYVNVRAVLVNPAVSPYLLLEDYLGECENYHSGERYEFTREHLEQLIVLETPDVMRPEAYLLLVQTADETLDYMDAVRKYAACKQFVQPGGSHSFEQFEDLIPAILAFADGRIDLPAETPIASPQRS